MRFVSGGPDLPDDLVAAQRRGQALFVCGAGVSMTVGLPSFACLVRRVYKALDQDWRRHPAEAGVMERGNPLYGQYDRMLRSLERRLAADDVPEARRMRQQMLEAVEAALAAGDRSGSPDHLALLELSCGADGTSRLLTTNFDTLFERAAEAAGMGRVLSRAGASLPRPGTASFEGVLHLHGRIEDCPLKLTRTELVLNSADFGEAYLRSGWAARYVYDLSRAFIVVLVGYSADDPPMRYLLEVLEADRARYPDLKPVYAFTPAEEGQEKLATQLWAAKGVTAIPYVVRSAHDHGNLYATLRAWRDFAADPTRWRRTRLEAVLCTGSPSDGDAVEEVVSLLSHEDAYPLIAEVRPSAEWWSPLRRHAAVEARGSVLGAWVASRLDDPAMLDALVADRPSSDEVFERIWSALALRSRDLDPDLLQGWRLLLRASLPPRWDRDGLRWYTLLPQIRPGCIDHGMREEAVEVLRPRLRVKERLDLFGADHHEPAGSAWRRSRVEFVTNAEATYREVLAAWPDDPNEMRKLLRMADRAFADALDEAAEHGLTTNFDVPSHQVHLVSTDDGSPLEEGFFHLVRLVASLWDRLASKDASAAAVFARAWSKDPHLLRRRLWFHALASPDVLDPAEVCHALVRLDDQTLWASDARREIVRVLVERWPDFDEASRTSLEARLRQGPPGTLNLAALAGDVPWQVVSDHETLKVLGPIRAAGHRLASETLEALQTMQERLRPYPDPGLDVAEGLAGLVHVRGHPERLRDLPDEEVLGEALRLQASDWIREARSGRSFAATIRAGPCVRCARRRWRPPRGRRRRWIRVCGSPGRLTARCRQPSSTSCSPSPMRGAPLTRTPSLNGFWGVLKSSRRTAAQNGNRLHRFGKPTRRTRSRPPGANTSAGTRVWWSGPGYHRQG